MKIVAVLVYLVVLACGVHAQEPATSHTLDGRTPAVVELASGDPAVSDFMFLRPAAERALFDRIAAGDQKYVSYENHGVVVVRPVAALRDGHNPLNRQVTNVAWTDVTPNDVMNRVSRLLWPWLPAHKTSSSMDTDKISIVLSSGSVFDLLVAAARAHGRAEWAVLPHRDESVALSEANFDHHCLSYRPVLEIFEQHREPGTLIPMGGICPSRSPANPTTATTTSGNGGVRIPGLTQ